MFSKPFFSSLVSMTRYRRIAGAVYRRARISSADARFSSAKMRFMISRSRRVSRSPIVLGIVIVSHSHDCATLVT